MAFQCHWVALFQVYHWDLVQKFSDRLRLPYYGTFTRVKLFPLLIAPSSIYSFTALIFFRVPISGWRSIIALDTVSASDVISASWKLFLLDGISKCSWPIKCSRIQPTQINQVSRMKTRLNTRSCISHNACKLFRPSSLLKYFYSKS